MDIQIKMDLGVRIWYLLWFGINKNDQIEESTIEDLANGLAEMSHFFRHVQRQLAIKPVIKNLVRNTVKH